jgi:phosphoribosylamine-glycine ligase
MANFLLITRYFDGAGLAHRLKLEGNDVKVFFTNEKIGRDYKGMSEKVENINEGLADDPYCIFDMTGMEKLAEVLQDAGYPVIGSGMGEADGGYLADKMEHDRVYAIEVMLWHGIPVPETHFFDNPKEAIGFLEKEGGKDRWVAKPCNEAASSMTIVSKNNEQLKAELQGWVDNPKEKNIKLILQKFVKGTEVNCEIYFSNGDPILPATVLFETKKLMNDNIGPAVGCAASTIFPYYGTKLIDKTLKKLYPFIKKTSYTGPADCSVILDERGEPWFLEAGWRFGWSSTYAELALLDMPFGEFVAGLCDGKLKTIPWKQGYAGSLRVSIPPYPYENEELRDKTYEHARGIEISGNPFMDPNIFPIEVYREGGPMVRKYKTMGLFGVVCEVADFSPSLAELWSKIEKKAEALELPDKQYRTDNLKAVARRIAGFHALGYGKAPERNQPQNPRAGELPARGLSRV